MLSALLAVVICLCDGTEVSPTTVTVVLHTSHVAEPPAKALLPDTKKTPEKAFEWRIFSVPAVQALVWGQVSSNTADYTLSQWAPIYYSQVLQVPMATVGAHLALPQIVNTVGVFAIAGTYAPPRPCLWLRLAS